MINCFARSKQNRQRLKSKRNQRVALIVNPVHHVNKRDRIPYERSWSLKDCVITVPDHPPYYQGNGGIILDF